MLTTLGAKRSRKSNPTVVDDDDDDVSIDAFAVEYSD